MLQMIMAKSLSLTSLHAFIACFCALGWQVPNLMLALGLKDIGVALFYFLLPVLLIMFIYILDQYHEKKKPAIKYLIQSATASTDIQAIIDAQKTCISIVK